MTAGDGAPFTYQWQVRVPGLAGFGEYSDLYGASQATFTLASTPLGFDGALFRVRVSNASLPKGVWSSPATLHVSPVPVAPSITAQPADVAVLAGATAAFSVVATGTAPLACQWQRAEKGSAAFADLAGSTSSTLAFVVAAADDGAQLRALVRNGQGEATSAAATLRVYCPGNCSTGQACQAGLFASPASILAALPLDLNLRIRIAENLIVLLSSTGRYRDAVELNAVILSILQRLGDPAYKDKVQAFINRSWTLCRRAFTSARSSMEANTSGGHPFCIAEALRFGRPMMAWATVLQSMEGFATGAGACPGYSGRAWAPALNANMKSVEAAEKAGNEVEMFRCDCRETPTASWTLPQQINCPKLGVTSGLRRPDPRPAAVAPEDVPTTDEEWDQLADTVARAYLESDVLAYLGLGADAGNEKALLADPHLGYARGLTFAGCRRDGSQKPVAKLLAVAPGLRALQDDGQYCATALAVAVKDASGTVLPQLAASLGGVDAGQAQTSSALGAVKTGKLSLSGPIAPLYCPPGSTDNGESRTVKLDGIPLQTSNSRPYLFTPLELDVGAALASAHPGAVDRLTRATLTLERTGDGCGGFWGVNPAPLLSLTLNLNGKIVFEKQRTWWRGPPAVIHGNEIWTINPDGTALTQVTSNPAVDYTCIDEYGKPYTCPQIPHDDSTPALSPDGARIAYQHVTLTSIGSWVSSLNVMNADGSGDRPVTAAGPTSYPSSYYPWPGDSFPSWSPDGRKVAFLRSPASGSGLPSSIQVLDLASGNLTQIVVGINMYGPAAWSPDGKTILFQGYTSGGYALFLVNPDGSNLRTLPVVAGYEGGSWSPDGTQIVFGTTAHEQFFVVDADGSNLRQLNNFAPLDQYGPEVYVYPAWR